MLDPDKYKGKTEAQDWKNLLETGLCIPAILVEYANYAIASTKGRVPDQVIDSLFDKLNTVLHMQKDRDGNPITSKSRFCSLDPKINPNILLGGYFDELGLMYQYLCPILPIAENAKTRTDKVLAIEQIMSAHHENGFLLEYGCDAHVLDFTSLISYQKVMNELTGIVLDMLFERK